MDTPDNAGSDDARGQLLPDVDVQRWFAAYRFEWSADTFPDAWAAVFKALAEADRAQARALLFGGRIRRCE